MVRHQENTSIKLINENDFDSSKSQKAKNGQKFSRGHITSQYMSGVGVITVRYVDDENLLFCEPENSADQYSSTLDLKPHESSTDQEEDEEDGPNTIVPVTCPCYERALKDEYNKRRYFKCIFSRITSCFKRGK